MLFYKFLVLFRLDKVSFYQSWGSRNVSRYVAIPVNRISIGDEKVKVIIDCETVQTF